MILILRVIFAVLVAAYWSGQVCAEEVLDLQYLKDTQDFELKKGYGFVLLKLDVDGVAPSFEYAKIVRDRFSSSTRKINFSERKSKYMLVHAKQGYYQITRVNAPYYDLPFWFDTSTDTRWRFYVEKGKINYLGLLEIDKDRTRSSVNINLIKRIASDYKELVENFSEVFKRYPLTHLPGYRDDFYQEFSDSREMP